jgi:hypothetical protein
MRLRHLSLPPVRLFLFIEVAYVYFLVLILTLFFLAVVYFIFWIRTVRALFACFVVGFISNNCPIYVLLGQLRKGKTVLL